MHDKLRSCIDTLFEDAPQSLQTVELKEEILQNLTDKYDELVESGKSPEAAYNIAVAGIGDISELVESMGKSDRPAAEAEQTAQKSERLRKKSALITSIAVALYIICPAPLILLSVTGDDTLAIWGVIILLGIVAVATCLLVYNSESQKKLKAANQTVVEEFREWQYSNSNRHQVRKAINSCIWTLTLVAYFAVSFYTHAWAITWLIFLIGSSLSSVVKAIFDLTKK